MTDRKTGIIIPLDVDSRGDAIAIVDRCGNDVWYKVGFQLFTRCGPPVVEELKSRGCSVFLDLKFHDIPNTVAKGAKAAADLGADLITLHAVGACRMIAAAREAVEGSNTKILAVTVLTSLSDEELRSEVGLPETAAEAVPRLAKQSVEAGAHGLVASPKEITLIRDAVGPVPLIVTPGIRPAWASTDDQARIATPAQAAKDGADFIVIGRPITKHENPAEAVRLILEEVQT